MEVGSADEFKAWLASTGEGWFFLDSVDEAQLETPRALEDAIRIFATRIRDAGARARIYITSRDDAWQALPDRTLIEQHLPYGEQADNADGDGGEEQGEKSGSLKVFRLAPLKQDEIFDSYHGMGDVDAFLNAIDRANLMPLAERPFDLKALIGKWQADRVLGSSRLEVLLRVVDLQIFPLSVSAAPTRILENPLLSAFSKEQLSMQFDSVVRQSAQL